MTKYRSPSFSSAVWRAPPPPSSQPPTLAGSQPPRKWWDSPSFSPRRGAKITTLTSIWNLRTKSSLGCVWVADPRMKQPETLLIENTIGHLQRAPGAEDHPQSTSFSSPKPPPPLDIRFCATPPFERYPSMKLSTQLPSLIKSISQMTLAHNPLFLFLLTIYGLEM